MAAILALTSKYLGIMYGIYGITEDASGHDTSIRKYLVTKKGMDPKRRVRNRQSQSSWQRDPGKLTANEHGSSTGWSSLLGNLAYALP